MANRLPTIQLGDLCADLDLTLLPANAGSIVSTANSGVDEPPFSACAKSDEMWLRSRGTTVLRERRSRGAAVGEARA